MAYWIIVAVLNALIVILTLIVLALCIGLTATFLWAEDEIGRLPSAEEMDRYLDEVKKRVIRK